MLNKITSLVLGLALLFTGGRLLLAGGTPFFAASLLWAKEASPAPGLISSCENIH